MSEETEREVEALASLTVDEWLDIREAAMRWAHQVNHWQPGPEPLLGVAQRIKTEARREGADEVRARVEAALGTALFDTRAHRDAITAALREPAP